MVVTVLMIPALLATVSRQEGVGENRNLASVPEKPHDWENAQNWLSDAWANRKIYSGPGWHTGINIRNYKDMLSCAPHNNEYHNAIGRTPIRDLLRTLSQPVLSMAGERDVLLDGSKEAAELAPNGCYVNIDDGGGDVVDHHTEKFIDAIDRFLKEAGVTSR